MENDLKGNENYFELTGGSSYRGFELPGVDCTRFILFYFIFSHQLALSKIILPDPAFIVRAFKDARLSVTTTGTPPIVLSLMKNSTVLGRAVSAGKFKLSGQGNYSCVAVNNYGNYTRIDFSVVFIGKYCLVCDVVSFFYRIPLNPRTYIQEIPTVYKLEGGGGVDRTPLGF